MLLKFKLKKYYSKKKNNGGVVVDETRLAKS